MSASSRGSNFYKEICSPISWFPPLLLPCCCWHLFRHVFQACWDNILYLLKTKWNRWHCPTFRGLYNADKECGYPINPKGYPHLPRVLWSPPVLQLDRGPVPVRERKVNVDAIHRSSSPAATLLSLCGVTFTNLCFQLRSVHTIVESNLKGQRSTAAS